MNFILEQIDAQLDGFDKALTDLIIKKASTIPGLLFQALVGTFSNLPKVLGLTGSSNNDKE